MFIIKKRGTSLFVATPGHVTSYTNTLLHARTFRTREDAQRELCIENEYIADVDDVTRPVHDALQRHLAR